MRRPIVAGNWKMNGSRAMAQELLDGILAGLEREAAADVAVCPPFVLIPAAAEKLRGSAVAWGAQDLDVNGPGAYTGAVAGEMLKDLDCRFCIVGHSERRTVYGESDELVARITAGGTPEQVKAKVREYMDNGATCPILYPLSDDVRFMIDTFANGYSS